MKVAEIQKKATAKNQTQTKRAPFFNKEGQSSFFSKSNESTQSFFSPTTIQPKLTIGQPNDKYEVEADSMADKVVQKLSKPKTTTTNNVNVQKKCSACGEEEKLQKKENDELLQNSLEVQRKPIFESNGEAPEADVQTKLLNTPVIQFKCATCEQEEKLQKKEEELSDNEMDVQAKSMDSPSEGAPDLQNRLNSSKGGGNSLSSDTQSSMGSAFGADFSGVRVHTGSEAVQMNKDLGAQAFTHGNDIYFNEGKYDTNSNSGKHLLAHELTHTVQQGGMKTSINKSFQTINNSGSFISRLVQPTRQQRTDARNVRLKMTRAIRLLQNASQYLTTIPQTELLDEMLTVFNQITPNHIGTKDVNGQILNYGRPIRLSYIFRIPGQIMSRPFSYNIRFNLSHETRNNAAGYFRGPSNFNGFIVILVSQARSASVTDIAKLLAHETIHMFSHLQRAVTARIGSQAATQVPGSQAALIINTSGLNSHKQNFQNHFRAVRTFLNNQSHRRHYFSQFPQSIVDDWTRQVIEESIAYVYQSRIGMAIDRIRTARSTGPTVNIASGFSALRFLRDYLTGHWLTDPADQSAMATSQGQSLLGSMYSDMNLLHQAVETQVGGMIQPKLNGNQPSNEDETEADSMADKVVNRLDNESNNSNAETLTQEETNVTNNGSSIPNNYNTNQDSQTNTPNLNNLNDSLVEERNDGSEQLSTENNVQEVSGNEITSTENLTSSQTLISNSREVNTEASTNAKSSTLELNSESSEGMLNSLSSSTPSGFINGMTQAKSLVPQIQENENIELENSLPEITQPTGLPLNNRENPEVEVSLETEGVNMPVAENEVGPLQIEEVHEQVEGEVNVANIPTPRANTEEDQNFTENIRRATSSLPTSDSTVNTSAGTRPNINLTGDANPNLNEEGQQESNENVLAQQQQADNNVSQDFGENNIYPEYDELEQLRPTISSRSLVSGGESELGALPNASEETLSNFDIEGQASMDEEVGAEMSRNEVERERMNEESENERVRGMEEIDQETERTRLEQETAQTSAREEVTGHQQTWREENEAVRDEYSQRSNERRTEIDTQIDAEVTSTEQQVETELTNAEGRAETERQNTEREARTRRVEAERQQENQGFWDRVTSAVSDFFDALKEGLNALFDGLRQLVADIIEAAKSIVNTLIDAARNLIVSFIEQFGEFLKGLVDIALAAFPEIAERVKGWIDQAVEVAVNVVNALADTLKEIANAILDAVGAVLDFILAAYQAFYNALLDVLEFIAVGFLRILEGLANLVSSAIEMPGNFLGQLSEEFLGMDVTSPLAFEKTGGSNRNTASEESSTDITEQQLVSDFVSRDSYSESDFHVDSVPDSTELSPDMMTMISQMDEGQELNFGENNDNTMDGLLADLTSGMPENESENGMSLDSSNELMPEPVSESPTVPPEIMGDPYAQVDWYIDYQNSQGGGANDMPENADGAQAADSTSFPEEMKLIGPLTVGARLHYLRRQMTDAISKKWEENKWTYIGIGAAIVTAITALAFATGGAIFSLIPPALQIFAVIMGGLALIKAGEFFSKYITEGWVGNIVQGGKNLARSIGILLVELIFILLFDMNTVLKVMKAGVKGSVRMAAEGAKNTFRALGAAAKASGKGLMRSGGRMVAGLRGIGRSSLKGIRNLDDLGRNLLRRFRFKGFKIQRRGRRFNILGNINPWVLLASGEVREVRTRGGVQVGQHGRFVTRQGDEAVEGILIGGNREASSFVRATVGNTEQGAKIFERLSNQIRASVDDIARVNGRGVPRNPNFRRNLFKLLENQGVNLSANAKKFLAVHHIVPNFLKGNSAVNKLLRDLGHNIDEVSNAIGLPRVNISLLNDVIRNIDEALAAGRNVDELMPFVNEVKAVLGLGGDVDVNSLRSMLNELRSFRSSAIHAVDSYHPAFNRMMKTNLENFAEQFDELILAGRSESQAMKIVGPRVNAFLTRITEGLSNGTITL